MAVLFFFFEQWLFIFDHFTLLVFFFVFFLMLQHVSDQRYIGSVRMLLFAHQNVVLKSKQKLIRKLWTYYYFLNSNFKLITEAWKAIKINIAVFSTVVCGMESHHLNSNIVIFLYAVKMLWLWFSMDYVIPLLFCFFLLSIYSWIKTNYIISYIFLMI